MKAALDAPTADADRECLYVDHIREGLRQAETGEFASEAEIATAFARWRK
jgi:predicted transcriptional regulator